MGLVIIKSQRIKNNSNQVTQSNIGGTYNAGGDVWPYNGLSGFLHSYYGDNVVSVYDEDISVLMGNDPTGYLEKHSKKEMEKEEKKRFYKGWCTVVLREGKTMWIPFGCMHTVIPLSNRRESLTGELRKDKEKSKPGRSKKAEDAEYSSLLFFPVLGLRDDLAAPKIVCSVAGRFNMNKVHASSSWEANEAWKAYMKKLEAVVSRTTSKAPDGEEKVGESVAPSSVAALSPVG